MSERQADPGTTRRPAALRWAPAALLGAAAAAMVAVLIVVAHGVWWSRPAAQPIRNDVIAAATTCVIATNSYRYTQLDAFERAGLSCTAGSYAEQFRLTVDTFVRRNAPTLKFDQAAVVEAAGVQGVAAGTWTVLLYGTSTVTQASHPAPLRTAFAARAQMRETAGTWFMVGFQTVQPPRTG